MDENKLYFIDPNRNDKFSNLRGLDLQDLIVQIENFYLIYRDKLDFPNIVTFGIEIEYEDILKKMVNNYIKKNFSDWRPHGDSSLDSGGEITSPILKDEIKRWKEIKVICDYLKKHNANTLNNAGGHIHVGAQILGENIKNWQEFIKTYIVYESIIFRFLYGDKNSARKKMTRYAPPIADKLYSTINYLEAANNMYKLNYCLPSLDRYQSINFSNIIFLDIYNKNVKNTIEFRSPNATVEEVVWQNNINTLVKLLLAPSKGLIDIEYVDYKLKNDRISSTTDILLYDIVNIKSALEFVDFVFDNNLDKVYFLRQYFKGFTEYYGANKLIKSKKFVK